MDPREEDHDDPGEDEEIGDLNWAVGFPQNEEANVNEILRFEAGWEEREIMRQIEEDLAIMTLLARIECSQHFHFGIN